LGYREHLGEPLLDLGLGHRAEERVHHLAAYDRDDHRDGLRLERLCEPWVSVHVDLGEYPRAAGLVGELLKHRAELLARAAPLCPQVHDHWRGPGAERDVVVEGFFGYLEHKG